VSIPFGELVFVGPIPNHTLYLFDYASNQIFLMKKDKASPIINMIYTLHTRSENKRCLFYFKDSTFHLITSFKEHLALPISRSDFTPTQISIYTPQKEKSVWETLNSISLITLIFSVILSISSAAVLIRNRKKSDKTGSSSEINFSNGELALIISIVSKPGYSILPDEANIVLGTTKKSVDVQKKHRSDVIKAINEKYHSLTNDSDNLIIQERLETDRRQVRYVISPHKYHKIQGFLPNGHSGKQNNS